MGKRTIFAFTIANFPLQFNLCLLIKQAFKFFLTDEYDVLYDVESKTDEIPHIHAIFLFIIQIVYRENSHVKGLNNACVTGWTYSTELNLFLI